MEEVYPPHIRHGRVPAWTSDILNVTRGEDGSSVIQTTTVNVTLNTTFDYNDTNVTCQPRPHDVDPSVFIYTATFLIVFCIISLAINIVILSSVCFMRTRVYPTLYISLSLAGADTFSLFFFALGLFLFSLLPRLDIHIDAPCTMLLIEALRMGAIMTTMFHLAALAGNHYLGILRPLRYPIYMTRRNIQYCIVVLWTIPSSLLVLDMFFLEGDWFTTCPYHFLKRSKFRMRFSIPFFTTLGMMIFIYCHIYKLVCKHQTQPLDGKYQRNLKYPKDKSRGSLSSFSRTQVNEKAIVTTVMILGSSIFGWLPAFTYFAFFCEDCLLHDYWNLGTVNEFITIVTINFLLIFKTATNSYIYAFRMKEIKIALRRMRRRLLMQLFAPDTPAVNSEWSGVVLTRTTSRQSTTRSRTMVLRMNSCRHGHEHLAPEPSSRGGSLRRCRSISSRHKQSNTSV